MDKHFGINALTRKTRKDAGDRGGVAGGWLVAIGLGLLAAIFALRASWVGTVFEDTFISLRYARNLIAGEGLVFNPGGERVEGITNLLWTLLLAAGSWASGLELTTVALALGCAAGALTLLVAHRWCRSELISLGLSEGRASLAALIAPFLLVLAPGFVFYSASGLEPPMVALLLTGGLFALGRARSAPWCIIGGLMLGAAAITRPDAGIALVLGVAAYCLFAPELRLKVLCVVSGFLPLAAATLFRLAYYGSPVPNTFHIRASGMDVVTELGLPYLARAGWNTWFVAAWVLALAAALAYRGFLRRNLAALLIVPAWSAYIVYAGGDYLPAHRFFVPMLPILYVLSVPGMVLVYRLLRESLPRNAARLTAGALAGVLLAAFVYFQLPGQLERERSHKLDNDGWTEYRQAAARWVEEENPDALVAANAVGAFGYYAADIEIVDMLGLNDSQVARHGQINRNLFPGHQIGHADYVLSREPDYIIPYGIKPAYSLERTAPYLPSDRQLARSPEFHENYEPMEVRLKNGEVLSLARRV